MAEQADNILTFGKSSRRATGSFQMAAYVFQKGPQKTRLIERLYFNLHLAHTLYTVSQALIVLGPILCKFFYFLICNSQIEPCLPIYWEIFG